MQAYTVPSFPAVCIVKLFAAASFPIPLFYQISSIGFSKINFSCQSPSTLLIFFVLVLCFSRICIASFENVMRKEENSRIEVLFGLPERHCKTDGDK